MSSQPTKDLSIIIGCYNFEKYIPMAIQTILNQETEYSYEIIVLDDQSKDNTWQILQTIKTQVPDDVLRIYRTEPNAGSARAAMYQLRPKTNGRYIAWLDGDDFWYSKDKIQKQISFLDQNPDYIASTHMTFNYVDDEGINFQNQIYGQWPEESWDIAEIINHPHNFYCHISSYIFRNKFRDEDGFFLPEEFAYPMFLGDVNLAMLFFRDGGKIKNFKDGIVSVYRVTGKGYWTDKEAAKKQEILMVQTLALDLVTLGKYRDLFESKYVRHAQKYVDQFGGDKKYLKMPKLNADQAKNVRLMKGLEDMEGVYDQAEAA